MGVGPLSDVPICLTCECPFSHSPLFVKSASRLGAAPSLPLTVEQSAARQQHIADALATLREVIAAGYKNFASMQKDADLTPLRDLPEFHELIKTK